MNDQEWRQYLSDNPFVRDHLVRTFKNDEQTIREWGPRKYAEAQRKKLEGDVELLKAQLERKQALLEEVTAVCRSLRYVPGQLGAPRRAKEEGE